MATGLDGRDRDKGGQIRKKNSAVKMETLAATYPELRVFTPSATLKGIEHRHGISGLEEARALARKIQRSRSK